MRLSTLPRNLQGWPSLQIFIRQNPGMIINSNTTYYVGQSGSDANNGLTPATAFGTIAHAFAVIAGFLVPSNVTVTVQLLDGTIEIADTCVAPDMDGTLLVSGNMTTPANVDVSLDGTALAFQINAGRRVAFQGFKISSVSAGGAFLVCNGGYASINKLNFGANLTNSVITVQRGGFVECVGDFTISASTNRFVRVVGNAQFDCLGRVVSLTGTLAWSVEFIYCDRTGVTLWSGSSFTGSSPTGKRYTGELNAVIATSSGSATFFPGSVAGTLATGAQYS